MLHKSLQGISIYYSPCVESGNRKLERQMKFRISVSKFCNVSIYLLHGNVNLESGIGHG